jgi:hypothetical protein
VLVFTIAIYVPMRLLFITCTQNQSLIIQRLATPLALVLPGAFFWFVFRRLDNIDPADYTPPWTAFFVHPVRITIFALFPVFIMFTVMILGLTAKLVVMVVNLITLHTFKKASEKQQPFTYAAGLLAVILALIKIIDEISKLP